MFTRNGEMEGPNAIKIGEREEEVVIEGGASWPRSG